MIDMIGILGNGSGEKRANKPDMQRFYWNLFIDGIDFHFLGMGEREREMLELLNETNE